MRVREHCGHAAIVIPRDGGDTYCPVCRAKEQHPERYTNQAMAKARSEVVTEALQSYLSRGKK